MRVNTGGGGGVIIVTLLLALALSVAPLPHWLEVLRPEWVTLVLIYWVMALPQRIGVVSGWLIGLLLDVLHGTLLGQYALTLALVAYLTRLFHQRLRAYPMGQQSLVVLMLVALELMLQLWIRGVQGAPPSHWSYWLPLFSSALLWPPLFVILRDLRQRYQVS